jgi:flavin-dependent dehydrogenase
LRALRIGWQFIGEDDEKMNATSCLNAVIIGAGPAGLGASIGLARKGIAVTVIEQQEKLGSVRRGETIRANMHMEEILGHGFFERVAIRKIYKRRYFSHTGKCQIERAIKNPNIIFSWPDLINEIVSLAENSGVRFLAGLNVTALIEHLGKVNGVMTSKNGVAGEFLADVVISCGGCHDPASHHIRQDRSDIDMAVTKRLVRGYTGQERELEYHFHIKPTGIVVGTMFPRGGGEAEFILLDTSRGNHVQPAFDEFSHFHPEFGKLLDRTQTFYELETCIPMGGMLYPFSPRQGLVMAGDALGHVQARGGSGIRTSFLIGHAAGSIAADIMHSGGWTQGNSKKFEKTLKNHSQVRSLRLHNFIFSKLRTRIFKCIISPEDMDKKWPILQIALR